MVTLMVEHTEIVYYLSPSKAEMLAMVEAMAKAQREEEEALRRKEAAIESEERAQRRRERQVSRIAERLPCAIRTRPFFKPWWLPIPVAWPTHQSG